MLKSEERNILKDTNKSFSIPSYDDRWQMVECQWCKELLNQYFPIFFPTWREKNAYRDSNGYFGYQDEVDEEGEILNVRK